MNTSHALSNARPLSTAVLGAVTSLVMLFTLALALVTLLAGCGSDLDPGSLIERTRVLGGRVEVEGEPERAWPEPGERATLRLVMAWPGDAPALSWALVACVGGSTPEATPCSDGILASAEGTSLSPSLTLQAPSATELGERDRIDVLGIVCEGGTPRLDEETGQGACDGDGAEATPLQLSVRVGGGDAGQNANPSLTDEQITLDEEPWTEDASEAEVEGCADGDGSMPRVAADGEKRSISITLVGDDREQDEDGVRETLQLSHFVSAGELARQFSFVEPEDASEEPVIELEWTAPEAADVPATGQLVRFVLVARDQRGGLDVTTRTLCAVP